MGFKNNFLRFRTPSIPSKSIIKRNSSSQRKLCQEKLLKYHSCLHLSHKECKQISKSSMDPKLLLSIIFFVKRNLRQEKFASRLRRGWIIFHQFKITFLLFGFSERKFVPQNREFYFENVRAITSFLNCRKIEPYCYNGPWNPLRIPWAIVKQLYGGWLDVQSGLPL